MNRLWVRLSLGFGGVLLATTLIISLVFLIIGVVTNHVGDGRGPWHKKNNYRDVINSVAGDLAAHYQAEQTWVDSAQILAEAQIGRASCRERV